MQVDEGTSLVLPLGTAITINGLVTAIGEKYNGTAGTVVNHDGDRLIVLLDEPFLGKELKIKRSNVITNEIKKVGGALLRLASTCASGICNVCQLPSDDQSEDSNAVRLGCRCLVHYSCLVRYIKHQLANEGMKIVHDRAISCPSGMQCVHKELDENENYQLDECDIKELMRLGSTIEETPAIIEASRPCLTRTASTTITGRDVAKLMHWLHPTISDSSGSIMDDGSSQLFIEKTSKPCPQCEFRESRPHGHDCHHVKYGCANCKVQYCYSCRSVAEENKRLRGSEQSCLCKSGFWSNFCSNENILDYISKEDGYPRDSRCGCCICAECSVGSPCGTCNGMCVVCTGRIKPGPKSLEAVVAWEPQDSSIRSRERDELLLSIFDFYLQTDQNERASAWLDEYARDINAIRLSGSTLLIDAASLGRHNIVAMLIAKGARVNFQRGDGHCALTIASIRGDILVIKELLAASANVDVSDGVGKTALMHAIIHRHQEATKILIKAGAALDIKCDDGKTALIYATNVKDFQTVQRLVHHGADVRLRDNDDLDALCLLTAFCVKGSSETDEAAVEEQKEYMESIIKLLKHGADCFVVSRTLSVSPSSLAAAFNHTALDRCFSVLGRKYLPTKSTTVDAVHVPVSSHEATSINPTAAAMDSAAESQISSQNSATASLLDDAPKSFAQKWWRMGAVISSILVAAIAIVWKFRGDDFSNIENLYSAHPSKLDAVFTGSIPYIFYCAPKATVNPPMFMKQFDDYVDEILAFAIVDCSTKLHDDLIWNKFDLDKSTVPTIFYYHPIYHAVKQLTDQDMKFTEFENTYNSLAAMANPQLKYPISDQQLTSYCHFEATDTGSSNYPCIVLVRGKKLHTDATLTKTLTRVIKAFPRNTFVALNSTSYRLSVERKLKENSPVSFKVHIYALKNAFSYRSMKVKSSADYTSIYDFIASCNDPKTHYAGSKDHGISIVGAVYH